MRLRLVVVPLVWTACAAAQELGNKVLGTLGLFAGSQPPSGLYIGNRFLFYTSTELIDRNGRSVRVGLDLDAIANATGMQWTFKLPWRSAFMNMTFAFPAARISLQTDNPAASIDRFGLGDIYVEPARIGWKRPRFDVVAGYSFYAPSGRFVARSSGGVGTGHWTHQFSWGGTVYFDKTRTWHFSELTSYNLNQRKRDIDITRGRTIQIQGGAGKTLGMFDVGVASYALWQVSDDRGRDLPGSLRGLRDRAFGLGPEVDITLKSLRSRIAVRYCHDVAVRARPLGQVLVVGFTILAFQ